MKPGRDERGRLMPGFSGNPGGRPRSKAKRTAFEDEKEIETCRVTLSAIRDDPNERAADRITATRVLLDYGLGRPVAEPVEKNEGDALVDLVALLQGAPMPSALAGKGGVAKHREAS